MTYAITTPDLGRGAWAVNGSGGTLSVDGKKPGPYYRAPAPGSSTKMPGLTAALARRNDHSVSVNDYAVHMGVKALQRQIGATQDGILGPKSEAAIKAWQKAHGLVADGVPGPKTFRAMLEPLAIAAAKKAAFDRRVDSNVLVEMVIGHIGHESAWDPGAVGYSTPDDLGLCQINGRWHPSESIEERLTPETALAYAAGVVIAGNLIALEGDEDAAIFAYNVGIYGARRWVQLGKPAIHYGVDAYGYINSVKKWMKS